MDSEQAARDHSSDVAVTMRTADRAAKGADFHVGQAIVWRGSHFLASLTVRGSARVGKSGLARPNARMLCLWTSWLVCRPSWTMHGDKPSGGGKAGSRICGAIRPRNSR